MAASKSLLEVKRPWRPRRRNLDRNRLYLLLHCLVQRINSAN